MSSVWRTVWPFWRTRTKRSSRNSRHSKTYTVTNQSDVPHVLADLRVQRLKGKSARHGRMFSKCFLILKLLQTACMNTQVCEGTEQKPPGQHKSLLEILDHVIIDKKCWKLYCGHKHRSTFSAIFTPGLKPKLRGGVCRKLFTFFPVCCCISRQ